MTEPKLLLLETSGRIGQVGVAVGLDLREVRRLDEARRHARDLAPTVAELLARQGWRPRDLQAVVVSRGPGSYTGLRVGIMSAKTLAYASGCGVIAPETFTVIAQQAPDATTAVDVLADAQQDRLYVQHFVRSESEFVAASALEILPATEWLARREPAAWVTGPGLSIVQDRLPAETGIVEATAREPQARSLLEVGLKRYRAELFDDVWALEPLYARLTSAEEKWAQQKK